MEQTTVSIITPAYNCESFIGDAINSVIAQTFSDWEMIIVDDCSTDSTSIIIEKFLKVDSRIKYFRLEKNSGAAIARSKGIELGTGKYIAFLDSDDVFLPEKIKTQVEFMIKNDYPFSCTHYVHFSEMGERMNRIIKCKKRCDYNLCVWMNPRGTSTVMFEVAKLGREDFPQAEEREDYALWLKMLRQAKYIYGLQEVLPQYRIRNDSVSSNKFAMVKYLMRLYREHERFGVLRSAFHVFMWGIIKLLRIK
ncbi:MAG: glycosyltransferase family 2 protein [Clostridiales bacterium]|nr:glycosyltransferase family 2 protein [Clostridiales bacterium]